MNGSFTHTSEILMVRNILNTLPKTGRTERAGGITGSKQVLLPQPMPAFAI